MFHEKVFVCPVTVNWSPIASKHDCFIQNRMSSLQGLPLLYIVQRIDFFFSPPDNAHLYQNINNVILCLSNVSTLRLAAAPATYGKLKEI